MLETITVKYDTGTFLVRYITATMSVPQKLEACPTPASQRKEKKENRESEIKNKTMEQLKYKTAFSKQNTAGLPQGSPKT